MQNYNRKSNYNRQQEPKKELTPEEKFELMIKNWKKESQERLDDLKKIKNSKIPDTRYALSPFRFLTKK